MEGTQEIGGQYEDYDHEDLVLRRADPDDCDAIINLVMQGEDGIYDRVYSYPKILKLIETAYLAITAIDRDGKIVAFAAFEDYPQGMRGMTDEKHFNYWEDWFKKAYQVDQFSAFNTLWLTYFIAGGSIQYNDQHHAFKQVLQTVYSSLPDLIGILFLVRGDADEDDIRHCFEPLTQFFEHLKIKDKTVLQTVRGIHRDSQVFFSSRVHVLPFIEIRLAQQEDHDDLADVFNSQSETITEAYGEYFIAELIAAQNAENKALVAQVKDKAIGLMGLTKEVDVKLLHKCFELDAFDNLLKPEYMDAIRARRELLKAQIERTKKNEEIAKLRQLKEETMKCNIISQRMTLQEHLTAQREEIMKDLDDRLANEEESKNLTKEGAIRDIFEVWLGEFEIHQPSNYFLESETDDVELTCNIQTKLQFLISTLEIFGLPIGYLDGKGHFPDWGKNKDDAKNQRSKKAKKAKKFNPGMNAKMAAFREKKGLNKDKEEVKPTHFDLAPIQKTLKKFLDCDAATRSHIRTELNRKQTQVRSVFRDHYDELSFKKCVDVHELAKKLKEIGVELEGHGFESLGSILICFGDIEMEDNWGEREPPETDEQRKARAVLDKMESQTKEKPIETKETTKKVKPLTKEQEEQKKQEQEADERKKQELLKILKPQKPIKVILNETSIRDLLVSLEKMSEFDRMLTDLEVTQFNDFGDEDDSLAALGKPYIKQLVPLPPIDDHQQYSDDPDIQSRVEHINDLTSIPDPPENAKNAFAITLFCMESAFDSRSKDFLKYAFDLFPDRDYLIVTQPHTIAENALLNKFTLVNKKAENTFSHVLYLIHRDYLLEQDIFMTRTLEQDMDGISELLVSAGENYESQKEVIEQVLDSASNPDSPWLSFSARVDQVVVATFLISKDVNLEYYKSHFHIQDQVLMAEHERKGHARLVFSMINPIFEKSTRFLMKELLRLSGKTCLYFEVESRTVIPTIFHELVHIRSRRFPHFLDRKWDHERFDKIDNGEDEDDYDGRGHVDGGDRDHLDEKESPFALAFTTKRLLSEPKIIKNSRIVVVGASDTGISFIEALLSISYLHFSNITLIAPGGLPHHHIPTKNSNLKAYSTSYTAEELKKLMLESRVQVLDSRMVDIDRSDKNIILHDGRVVPYDTLILTMGIQDKTLNSLKYASWGISPLPPGIKRCKGLLSIDDPYLYESLKQESPLMQALTDRRRPTNCVIYGRTLHTYCFVQGLLDRGVAPQNITFAIPDKDCHVNEEKDPDLEEDLPVIYPQAFEDEKIEQKIQEMLVAKGVTIVRNAKLIEIGTDKESKSTDAKPSYGNSNESEPDQADDNAALERVLFKRTDMTEEEEEEDELDYEEKSQSENQSQLTGQDDSNIDFEDRSQIDGEHSGHEKKRKIKKNELEIYCKVLVTAGHKDVDQDVFKSIHDNGLVYNGRLIVDRNFQTTDPSIFAAGSLCEFSNRYKALSQGRSLRMDRYNGREMGSRLARSVFDIYDPQTSPTQSQSQMDEELPLFFLPSGQGGVLPNNIIYYHIKTTNPMMLKPGNQEAKNRADLICDNLDCETGQGHFIMFTFNSIGLIDSVTYMGHEEVILQSLWSFVGLHENYLNQLTSRYDANIIPNVAEFLSENWAIALYHEWFGDFCLRMRQGIQGLADVQTILAQAFEKTKHGQGLTRENIESFQKLMDPKTVKMIEDETLEFIRTNMNHLPMYYIPGEEFE